MIALKLAAMGLALASVSGESLPEPETSVVQEAEPAAESFDWKGWLSELVSPQTLATITAIIGALASILKMASTVKKLAKEKNLTAGEVSKTVIEEIQKQVPSEIAAEMQKYLPSVVGYCEKTDKVLATFAKILALSQENTPESRVAILSLVQELGSVGNDTIEEAKKAIEEGVAKAKEAEDRKAKAIGEVIADTSSGYDGTSV